MNKLISTILSFACIFGHVSSRCPRHTIYYKNCSTERIVCYFSSWARQRPSPGNFDVENINVNLCTHLIYAFIGVNPNGTVRIDDPANDLYDNGGRGAIERFVALKSKNPELKMMVAIGGWNEGSVVFSNIMANTTIMGNLVDDICKFLKKYNFDGVDMDWEYPSRNGGAEGDKKNFVSFLKKLRHHCNKTCLIISAAVSATQSGIDASYDVPEMMKFLDFINIMAYDFNGAWDTVTGQNAPLYPSSKDVTDFQKILNDNSSIAAWIAAGASLPKTNLGVPAYGRTFTLTNSSDNGVRAPSSGPGSPGSITETSGLLSFLEISLIPSKLQNYRKVFDEEQDVPYIVYNETQWCGYDDVQSIRLKVEFAISLNIGGIMVWAIDMDDFHDDNPLLTVINDVLKECHNRLT